MDNGHEIKVIGRELVTESKALRGDSITNSKKFDGNTCTAPLIQQATF